MNGARPPAHPAPPPPWAAALLAAAVAGAAACGATPEPWIATWQAPYGEFDEALQRDFVEVRARMEAGDLEEAWVLLAPLVQAHPDNIELGVWMQDLELELLSSGATLPPELAALDPGDAPDQVLMRHYAQRVRDSPSVAGFVLAARMESDAIAAENLLDQALALDPSCAWAHYGRAHALLRQRFKLDRWRAARAALARALELDPAHTRARRLEAWADAQEGASKEASWALETWLQQTAGDPRVTPAERVEAELDLAMVWILRGWATDARQLLSTLEGEPVGRARRLATLAVAEQELGHLEAALDAARRAEDADPASLLPLVQQALIQQHGFADRAAAEAQWRRIAERAEGQADLASMLQGLRARVEIERVEDREAREGKGRESRER